MLEARVHTTKTIGILGGMGPAATADFYQRIITSTAACCDQEHLHVLIDSYSHTPDRTAFLLGNGEDPTPALLSMARRLEHAGADLLVIACNTAHAFMEELVLAVSIPIINWIDEATSGVTKASPHLQRVGLLATTGTIKSNLYQHSFLAHNVQVIIPDLTSQEQLMTIIYGESGLKAGHSNGRCVMAMDSLIQSFVRDNDIQAILLGCTELSLLASASRQRSLLPIFDASQIVAERVVLRAGGRLSENRGIFLPDI
ncbi:aspartate racemase [Dictyobacter alpinus]|uniref:Aspartate racemase n=1 Tax=Dictyobacter alpinus TaxID=2014873 RepID=A0A402BAZ9_9CHLR|nr:amino acid racemase [Dictyobacter alpinus]GCE28525.1 aspartate racemase [Dictyobacter alpinus]